MDLQKHHELWNESWRYFRHYAEKIPLSDDDWVEAIRMMSEFVDRHLENEAFARKLIIMVMRELEAQDKKARPENEQ